MMFTFIFALVLLIHNGSAFHRNLIAGVKRTASITGMTLPMAGFGNSNPSSTSSSNSKQGKKKREKIKSIESTPKVPPELAPSSRSGPLDMGKYFPSMDISYPGVRAVYSDPPIFEIDNFFQEDLCDDYIKRAQSDGLQMNSQTFSSATSAMRTSTTWYLKYKQVGEFLKRATKLTGKAVNTFEEPQIVRYELGQQFSWHYDALPTSMKNKNGGQRVGTLLVYLNDVEGGGATCFKDLDVKIQPQKGKALLFFPCTHDGVPDDRTMHAGQVTMDTKWIAQMYVQCFEYPELTRVVTYVQRSIMT